MSRAEIARHPRRAPERSPGQARQAARPRPPRHRKHPPLELHPLRPAPPRPHAAAPPAGQGLRLGPGRSSRHARQGRGPARSSTSSEVSAPRCSGIDIPDVIAATRRFLEGEAVPFADQGSDRPREGAFARRLAQLVSRFTGGSYVVRLGSTGAEAVEIALAHAFLEREERLSRFVREQRRLFGSHSAGACRRDRPPRRGRGPRRRGRACSRWPEASTGRARAPGPYRSSGDRGGSSRRWLPSRPSSSRRTARRRSKASSAMPRSPCPRWSGRGASIEERTVRFSRIIAAIAEPIRGEGGVKRREPCVLARLSEREFPLILDEIQCGLGRSGRFLASEGVRGALLPLWASRSAAAWRRSRRSSSIAARYVERFDEYYAGRSPATPSPARPHPPSSMSSSGRPCRPGQRNAGPASRAASRRIRRTSPP